MDSLDWTIYGHSDGQKDDQKDTHSSYKDTGSSIGICLRHYHLGDLESWHVLSPTLATRTLYNEQGCPCQYLDPELKRRLETKLIVRILKFKTA